VGDDRAHGGDAALDDLGLVPHDHGEGDGGLAGLGGPAAIPGARSVAAWRVGVDHEVTVRVVPATEWRHIVPGER
jgi:hypothetical protein